MEITSIHKPRIVVIGSCNTDMVVKANGTIHLIV